MHKRPNKLPAMIFYLLRLTVTRYHIAAIILLFLAILCCMLCASSPTKENALRVATFNIENYPKHAQQGKGAMAEIRALRAPIVGVQEILNPARFRADAKKYLGEDWAFVHNKQGGAQRVGVLYDSTQFDVENVIEHRQIIITNRGRPALEVILKAKGKEDSQPIHLFVLHLKAGGDSFAQRSLQWRRMEPILRARMAQKVQLIVLGDMNSTGEADMRLLSTVTKHLGLDWATQDVACTAYWNRRDGCRGSRLDHILSWKKARRVKVGGACERTGCNPGQSCPVYCKKVSDHCPVSADF